MKSWIVAAILRLYPRAWRLEYGDELTGILLSRPLNPRTIADVLGNGLWQRARVAEPSTILGLAAMLVILTGFVFIGATGGRTWTALMQPSPRAFRPVAVMASGLFVSLLVVCGAWTHLRHGGGARRSGLAAIRMGIIAGIPIMLAGALMMAGLIEVTFVAPGLPAPAAWTILIAPVARWPEFWLWGAIGGKLGQRIRCWRQRAVATQP